MSRASKHATLLDHTYIPRMSKAFWYRMTSQISEKLGRAFGWGSQHLFNIVAKILGHSSGNSGRKPSSTLFRNSVFDISWNGVLPVKIS